MAASSRPTTKETIIHADHGAQFMSWAFTNKIRSAGLMPSFGSIGDAYDCQSVLVGLLVDSEDLTSVA